MSPPSPSKPYQVLELLPVWEGTTEDDRLVHFLSYCHGNNSCDQSALARADSGRPGGEGFRELMLAGLTPKRSQRNCPRWVAKTGLWDATVILHHNDKREKKRGEKKKHKKKQTNKTTGSILCCQCIVDRRKSVRTATLWHRNLAHVDPLSRFVSPLELYLTLPPVHPPLLSHPPAPPPSPQIPPPCRHRPVLFRERYSVKPSLVERFFCPMLVMHMCKKPTFPLLLLSPSKKDTPIKPSDSFLS